MHHLILAAGGTDFFSTSLGTALQSILRAVAILVVLVAAIKAVKHVMEGKGGKAAQLIIGAAIVVTFLWDTSLIGNVIDFFAGLVGKSTSSVNQLSR